jgi:uncharacterized protein (TIGR00725 family)
MISFEKERAVLQIGVVGAADAVRQEYEWAEAVGRELARRGIVVICGGLGGVMEATAKGVASEGGIAVGILPGPDRSAANPFVRIRVATDMGHARNVVLVRSSDGIIAIGGGYGTLSEVAIALKTGLPVVSLGSWHLGLPVIAARDPLDAVERILEAVGWSSAKAVGPDE